MTPSDRDDVQAVARLHDAYQRMKAELSRVIVGQAAVIDELLIALFARGHCLLEGVPGLAKTLMVRTLAGALTLDFRRIQFTPDLMPADVTGTEVIQVYKDHPEIRMILLDINMPEKDGYQVMREIRAMQTEVKIVFQTALAMADERQQIQDSGCDACLFKPISQQDLQETLRRLLGE